MNVTSRKFFFCCICYKLLLASADLSNLPPECKLYNGDKILDCSGMYDFPNGSFGDVEVVSFSDNHFFELPRDVFYNNGFDGPNTIILRHNHINAIQFKAFSFMSNTIQLDLSGNELTKLHRNSYSGLTSLMHLSLSSNKIETVETLDWLKFLDKLDLSNNSIGQLPKGFLKHDYLTYLDLSSNPVVFADRGPILESASLNQLFLRSCSLEKLPSEAFAQLKKLQVLDLSRNKLKEVKDHLFKPLVELKYLDISYNLITHLEPDMFGFARLNEVNCVGNPTQVYTGCENFLVTTMKALDMRIEFGNDAGGMSSKIWLSSSSRPPNTTNARREHGEDNKIVTIESLMMSIVVVGGICSFLLAILSCQMCYFKYVSKTSANHIYEEVVG